MTPERYDTIREIIGDFVGLRVLEITQHDQAEWAATHQSHVSLHFEDGRTLTFHIGDEGFEIEDPSTAADDVTDTVGGP